MVRLRKGDPDQKTVYGRDPVAAALAWEERGAEWLHVVDLDGALRGEPLNTKKIEEIVKAVKVPVQVSGGIRSVEALARWLDVGAARVVIGTKAFDSDLLAEMVERFGDQVVAAVDSKSGTVRVGGWKEESQMTPQDAARRLQSAGVQRLLFTDIERDGTLEGPNLDAIAQLLDAVDVPMIVGGGISCEPDVRNLAALAPNGLEAIIIGKALYSGALTLDEAKQAAGG